MAKRCFRPLRAKSRIQKKFFRKYFPIPRIDVNAYVATTYDAERYREKIYFLRIFSSRWIPIADRVQWKAAGDNAKRFFHFFWE